MRALEKTDEKELRTISFHRDNILLKPKESDLLTLQDADEHKLPALDFLLKTMYKFRLEMDSVGIKPAKEKEADFYKNQYLLTDSDYEDFEPFQIRIKSKRFDEKCTYALHAGFEFFLYIVQDAYQGRGEIADWIKIQINHVEVIPFSFASQREHVRALFSKEDSYFEDIPMEYRTTVGFGRMDDKMNFKTESFNKAVNDACIVMEKIMSRKNLIKSKV